MAAGIAKRDTGGARESRDKRGQQQKNPDEDEDEDTTEPRRKSRRIQDSSSQRRQQNPSVSSKTSRKSLRLQEEQAMNQQRTARGGQRRPTPFISRPARMKRKRLHDTQAEAEAEDKVDETHDEPLEPSEEDLQQGSKDEVEAEGLEGVRPSKTSGRLFPTTEQLSEHNLRIFNGEMNPGANNAPILERTSSSPSGSSEAETIPSQRSSDTNGHYRYNHLAVADVYIHTDAPGDIQVAIDSIVKAEVSKDRRTQLRHIAKELHEACKETVQVPVGEDDFVHPFLRALEAMNHDQIGFREKADWREELKPIPGQSDPDLSFLDDLNAMDNNQQQDLDDAPTPPPPKRQQKSSAQDPMHRPTPSGTMPPPASRPLAKKAKETSPIKTPRPDISIGTKKTAVISALAALTPQNVSNTKVKKFLKKLESTMVPSLQGGPAEPLLVAFPAQRASDLVFPFGVVEGKAYSTGKQVFEAQNQAAVAGASGLKIQLSLNELVKRSITSFGVPPSPFKDQLPLFFSICTEGPSHELWAHYTLIEDGVRTFNMRLLQICNGVLLEGVEDFMISIDNVLRWGAGPFLESVVERLGTVAKKIGA